MNKDIIIGGGISGLSFAMYDKGHDWTLLEKSDRIQFGGTRHPETMHIRKYGNMERKIF